MAHAYKAQRLEVEAEEYHKLEVSLSYMRLYLRKPGETA